MKNFEPKDLLVVDKMITPTVINVLYWILCAFVILGGIFSIIGGQFLAIIAIPFGLLYIRVMCELMVVMFKINANVDKIANKD